MNVATTSWEQRLVSWAYEGIDDNPSQPIPGVMGATLGHAYRVSTDVIRQHSRTFYLASSLLPKDKCRAARALYAFSRITDDLVDQTEDDPLPALKAWRQRALHATPKPKDWIVLAWSDTQHRYKIPKIYAEQLLDGVACDLEKSRYRTFEELAEYSYGVASTVGLMAMHIVGFDGPEAIPYAVKLGVALQLTNILRDVGEDWERGRLYLPQDELAQFGITEDDIAANRINSRWRAFMRFQVDRVRRLYRESLPGIAHLHRDGRFAIAAAAELYEAILDDLEAHSMDNLNRRACIGLGGKLSRLPRIWWDAKTLKPSDVLTLQR